VIFVTVKELKEILESECKDNQEISVQYCGNYIELDRNDCFKVDDYYTTDKRLYLEIE
jgi:hypothetical protein